MCTAVMYRTKGCYFGRNLDLEYSYEESVVVTPRRFPLSFRFKPSMSEHYAIIGMAYVKEGYPLYYDAMNEKGIGMAGLAFQGNAVYQKVEEGWDNVTPYELIPWVLSQCATLEEVKKLLLRLRLVDVPFSTELPNMPLHFMISDGRQGIVVEPMQAGLCCYDNPIGVLTNNPPFPYQLFHVNNYRKLTRNRTETTFAEQLELEEYSRGMGGIGLPGDLSSQSRFVRAAFVRMNSVSGESEKESVNQFFHILTSVEQQRGCVCLAEDTYEYTLYSSCCSLSRGIYYYTTYENRAIRSVDMRSVDIKGNRLILTDSIGKDG